MRHSLCFLLCTVFLIYPTLGRESLSFLGSLSAETQISAQGSAVVSKSPQKSWQDFQVKAKKTLGAGEDGKFKRVGWPTAAVVAVVAGNDSTFAVAVFVERKNRDVQTRVLYAMEREEFLFENAKSELAKMVKSVNDFSVEIARLKAEYKLFTDEQVSFAPSTEEQAWLRIFRAAGELLSTPEVTDKWQNLDLNLFGCCIAAVHIEDGQKYLIAGLVLQNKWGLRDRYMVAQYPIKELVGKDDAFVNKWLQEKAADTIQRVTDFLTKKPYATVTVPSATTPAP